jgi:hypothetical protein
MRLWPKFWKSSQFLRERLSIVGNGRSGLPAAVCHCGRSSGRPWATLPLACVGESYSALLPTSWDDSPPVLYCRVRNNTYARITQTGTAMGKPWLEPGTTSATTGITSAPAIARRSMGPQTFRMPHPNATIVVSARSCRSEYCILPVRQLLRANGLHGRHRPGARRQQTLLTTASRASDTPPRQAGDGRRPQCWPVLAALWFPYPRNSHPTTAAATNMAPIQITVRPPADGLVSETLSPLGSDSS